ncbi:MAG: hypothetical protein BRC54_06060 [Cyanobacteria bacterium SW_7_48_12]|nr:MAG: hypothetical protein BRC54_06060 [Cyanobacteria bacterium SW_7_48_12]
MSDRFRRWEVLLLLVWIGIGAVLRFSHLSSLPPWTDEYATIVYSLGNSFRTVPLNQFIPSEVLLQPLQASQQAGILSVVHYLTTEDTHPPLYFVLSHLWMNLFSPEGELASIWVARSLPALFGVASIPAMYGLGYLAFRCHLVAQMTAAIATVSPYGIYLAGQARHYTLVILFVIASLACFVIAIRAIHNRQSLPIWVAISWVGANSLGMATHYFFTLTLTAEGLVLLSWAWRQSQLDKRALLQPIWRRIYGVAAGTLAGCLVWLPALGGITGSRTTSWIADGNPTANWLEPIARMWLWGMSIISMLPSAITIIPLWGVVLSGCVTLAFWLGILPHLCYGWKVQRQNSHANLITKALGGYVLGAIALFVSFTYGLGIDLTLAPRFSFVYFPAAVALLGASLAACWRQLPSKELLSRNDSADYKGKKTRGFARLKASLYKLLGSRGGRKFNLALLNSKKWKGSVVVSLILLMGLVGGITEIWNLGYLQHHRPDLLAPIIQKTSQAPIFIATTHKHHGQTGRMMGLAWEFRHLPAEVQFFLAHRSGDTEPYANAIHAMQAQMTQIPRPFDLWLVDFHAEVDLESQGCFPAFPKRSAGEYWYRLYHCLQDSP